MSELKMVNKLTETVSELLGKYDDVCAQNEALRNELVTIKAQNEIKSNEIIRLEDELKDKNIESDDIVKKIEAVLGR